MKKYLYIVVSFAIVASFFVASAETKPSPDADLDSLSYVFYLYYENSQLVGDRDYPVKYDVLNEKFIPQSPAPGFYKAEIYDFKSKLIQTVQFDPKQGSTAFVRGKVSVKAPYVSDGARVGFFDDQNRQLMTLSVSSVALCNDDDFCNSAEGENEKTCFNDCRKTRTSPLASAIPLGTGGEEGLDYVMLGIYAMGGLIVVIVAWFGWKWWKKKKEGSFLPPPPTASGTPLPPFPPMPGL